MCVFQKHDDYNLREPEMTLGRAHECSIFSHNCHFPVLRRIESEVYAQLGINYRTLNDRASLIKCSRSRPGDQGHHSATKKCRFDGKKGIHETKRLRHSKPMNWWNGKNSPGISSVRKRRRREYISLAQAYRQTPAIDHHQGQPHDWFTG